MIESDFRKTNCNSTSALFQLGIRVSNISRFGDSPGSYRPTVANAKTANPNVELEQSTKRQLDRIQPLVPPRRFRIGSKLVSGIFGLAVLFSGCTQASLRDFPSLLTGKNKEASFAEMSKSETATLTIWHESFEEAQAASRESGKPILADFTGSDWCTWCIRLKKDVFETSEFKSWASENVTLLELDYPKRGIQSPAIRRQNSKLKDRYDIQSYPTVLLMDAEGEVIGKLGYMKTPKEWILKAETFLRKSALP